MPEVRLVDGTVIPVPDQPTPEVVAKLRQAQEIAAARVAQNPELATPQEYTFGGSEDNIGTPEMMEAAIGKPEAKPWNLFGGSLARGLGDLAVGATDMLSGDMLGTDAELLANSKDAEQAAAGRRMLEARENTRNRVATFFGAPQATTPGERVFDTTVRAATSAGLGMRSGRGALIGGTSGLSGQTAAEMIGPDSPWAPLVSAIASMVGGGVATGAAALPPRTAERALEGTVTDPKALVAAALAAKAARAEGIPMNTMDFDKGTNPKLRDTQDNLIALGGGDQISTNVRNQGPAIQAKGNALVKQLPGEVAPQQNVANLVQDAATERLGMAKKEATEAFDAELQRIKDAQRQPLEADAVATGAEVKDRQQDLATSLAGSDKMLAEDAADRAKADAASLAAKKDADRLDTLRAGREVSNETGFNIDELGNYGTMLAARNVRQGEKARTSYSAQDLLDAGLTTKEVRELVAKRQPTIGGTGVIQTDNSVEPAGITRVGQVGLDIRNRAVNDYLDAVDAHEAVLGKIAGLDKLDPVPVNDTRSKIDQMIRDHRGDQQMVEDLTYLRDNFANLSNTKELHNFIVRAKWNLPSVKLNSSGADISENSVLGRAIAQIKGLRNDTTPGYRAADDAYKAHMAARNDLAKNTDVGALAQRAGSLADADAMKTKFYGLMKEGQDPNVKPGPQDRFRRTMEELAKTDPEGLQTAFKSYISDVLRQSFGKGKTGLAAERPGETITGLLGDLSNPANDARLKGLQTVVDVLANQTKMTASEKAALQHGLEHFHDIANANARTPRGATTTSPRELQGVLENSVFQNLVSLIGVTPGSQMARAIRYRMSASGQKKLDTLLSDPDQVQTLIRMGKQPRLSRSQKAMVATAIGWLMTQNTGEKSEDKPPANGEQ